MKKTSIRCEELPPWPSLALLFMMYTKATFLNRFADPEQGFIPSPYYLAATVRKFRYEGKYFNSLSSNTLGNVEEKKLKKLSRSKVKLLM